MLKHSIFKKTYTPQDFETGNNILIYIGSRSKDILDVREGKVLDNGLEKSRIVRTTP